MNLLTLDFGNTRAHAALFQRGDLIAQGELSQVTDWLTAHHLTFGEVSGVLAQVKPYDQELQPLLQQGLLCERIKDYWKGQKFAGMPVHYTHTLGEDRLLLAYWAFKEFKTPTLVISAGSYVTLNVVTLEGFQGGHILPGLKLLSEDLQLGEQLSAGHFTGIEKNLLTSESLPQGTPEALQGAAMAYAALVQRLTVRWGIRQVVVSGGDCAVVADFLKPLTPELPFHVRPDLVHWALLTWYQRNIGS